MSHRYGATVSVIDNPTYQSLTQRKRKYLSMVPQHLLKLHGCFQVSIEPKSRFTVSTFYVVDGPGGNLLSAKTAQDPALIQFYFIISLRHYVVV